MTSFAVRLTCLRHQINSWVESGEVRPPKVSTFTLDEISEAHAPIQSGTSIGKIVLRTAFGDEKVRPKTKKTE